MLVSKKISRVSDKIKYIIKLADATIDTEVRDSLVDKELWK